MDNKKVSIDDLAEEVLPATVVKGLNDIQIDISAGRTESGGFYLHGRISKSLLWLTILGYGYYSCPTVVPKLLQIIKHL